MPKPDEVGAAWDRILGYESLGFGIPDVLEVWLRMNNGSTAKDSEKPIPGGGTARLPHRDSIIFPDGMRFLGCKEIAGRHAEYLHIARDIGDGDYWKTSDGAPSVTEGRICRPD
ncbi:hypothetical protein [Streptomyces canus]|uniref:hypothetical protein n=1 Tax=Streptomyces canus TaxID=58343 RepID=UPI002DDB4911|nr:hypothetical protein [Streptomyces canus]WSD86785.1 hypothetical protein OG925_21875 [Streptomyces canus]